MAAAIPFDLGETVLFASVPEQTIHQFLARTRITQFSAGSLLIDPSNRHSYMYLLISGEAIVRLDRRDGPLIATIKPGDCVGELSLLDGDSPSAYVVVAADCEALEISAALLWEMVNESHEVARNMVFLLTRRIRSGNAVVNKSLELHKRTAEEANKDALTGLYNRRWLDQTNELFEQQRCDNSIQHYGVIMLDVDHFKRINDNYGHAVGDDVLRMIAKILRDAVRPGDSVVRYGGEEFLVLLPEADRSVGMQVAERLRSSVAEVSAQQASKTQPVTHISLGVALLLPGHSGLGDLINDADKALYRAKSQGRNRVCIQGGEDQ